MYDLEWKSIGLYDEKIQEYICAYCNKTVGGVIHNKVVFHGYGPGVGNIDTTSFYILECPSCHKPTIYNVSDNNTYPWAKALRSVNFLPDNISKIYDEIRNAISAQCYTSAVILARTAIMHIAVEKQADENKKFAFYVDYLVEKGYVPPNAKDWIDRIRTMANQSVHKLEIWEREDAEIIGKFLMYLLVFIYELPNSIT